MNGEKRRVSFNNEPDVFYRTTSEESSNSTLKGIKILKEYENTFLLKDSPINYKSTRNYTKLRTRKMRKSQMDQQFDQLLNKNCSWSYRSRAVTQRSDKMETCPSSVQIQSKFTDLQQKMREKVVSDDESLQEEGEDELGAISKTCSLPKGTHNENSKPQEETRGTRKRSKPENVEENLPEATSTPIKTLLKRRFQINNKSSPSSSSEEEILQTRYSVKNKNVLHGEEQHGNQKMPISPATKLSEVSISGNDSNVKSTCPIIIQAVAHDETNSEINHLEMNNILENFEMNNSLDNFEMNSIISGDFLSIGANEIVNSFIQNPVKNNKDQLNNIERKGSHENKDRNEMLQGLMKKIAVGRENDSPEYEESIKATSDDFIIQDFLNGSLDLSINRSDRQPSSNVPKPTSNMQSGNSTLATMERNTTVFKNNKFKRGLFTNKEDNFKKKSNYFAISPNKTSKRKQTSKEPVKNTKKPRITRRKKTSKTVDITSEDSTDSILNSKVTKQKKKLNNPFLNRRKDSTVLNNFNSSQKEATNNKSMKNNPSKKKATKKDNEVSNANFYNKIAVRHSSRNTRNSSLIASRRIKEMEKLENSESDEECLDAEDEADVDFAGKHNFEMEKGNKYGYQIENTLSSEDSLKIAHIYPKRKHIEKTKIARNDKKHNIIGSTFYGCNMQGKSPLKQGNTRGKQIKNAFLASALNLSNECFMQQKENPSNNRTNKKDFSKESEMFYSSKSTTDKNVSRNEVQRILTYKGPVTRRKQKTWDMLEKELLGESENETSLSNNIGKTAKLKTEDLVKKQSVQNADLHTFSNTMLQSITKSTKGSKYITQYETNAERKYMESKVTNCKNLNTFNDTQRKDIVTNYSKNSILERTIAAMEKCTANIVTPQVTNENEEEGSVLQFGNISHYSNTSHEALFHSNITFMANENEQYYKNEIVGYLKKYSRRDRGNYFNKNGYQNSDDAEHLEENSFVAKPYLVKNNAEKINEKRQAVVPFLGEKKNTWNDLIEKLNLNQDDNGDCLNMVSNKEKNTTELAIKPLIQGNAKLDKYQKRKHKITNFGKEINEYDEGNDTESEQENFNKELDLLVDHAFKSKYFIHNLPLTANDGSKKCYNQKKKSNPESVVENLEKTESKLEKNEKVARMQMIKKSPKMTNFEKEIDKKNGGNAAESEQENEERELLVDHALKSRNFIDNFSLTANAGSKTGSEQKKTPTPKSAVGNLEKSEGKLEKNEKVARMQIKKLPKLRMTNFEKEIEQDGGNATESEQENFKMVDSKEIESLINHAFKSRNFIDNSSLTANAGSKTGSDQKKTPEPESRVENLEKSGSQLEKNEGVARMQTIKRSPKFKLQMAKNGNLKLKKHSSRSSSITNSSKDFPISKQNEKSKNKNGSTKVEDIKAKEKYQKYLKKITLIAKKDDDLFSLSSSDSETSNDKNPGTGLLCDLFEE